MEIFKEFKFEAAHSLPHLPVGHKCRNVHGHSYRIRVVLSGRCSPETGWLMDFAELKRVVKPLIDRLDHSFLNDIEGLSVSTSEMLAIWFWRQLKPQIPQLCAVECWETQTSGAIYRGEDEGADPR